MSVGVLPHVADARSIDQVYADMAARHRREAIAAARPQMGAVADVLARTLPGWQQLSEDQQHAVTFDIVHAVEAGF